MRTKLSFSTSDPEEYRIKLSEIVDEITEISDAVLAEKAAYKRYEENRGGIWSDPRLVKAMLRETGQKYLVGSSALWLYLHSIGYEPRFTPNDFDIVWTNPPVIDIDYHVDTITRKMKGGGNLLHGMEGRKFTMARLNSYTNNGRNPRGIGAVNLIEVSRIGYQGMGRIRLQIIKKKDPDPCKFVENFDIEVAKVIYNIEDDNFDLTEKTVLEHASRGTTEYFTQNFNLFVGRDLKTHFTVSALSRVKKYMERGFTFDDFTNIDELLIESSTMEGFKRDNYYTVDIDGPIRDIEEYILRKLSFLGFNEERKELLTSMLFYKNHLTKFDEYTLSSLYTAKEISKIFTYGDPHANTPEIISEDPKEHYKSFDQCIRPKNLPVYDEYPMVCRDKPRGGLVSPSSLYWVNKQKPEKNLGIFNEFAYEVNEPPLFGCYNIENRLFKMDPPCYPGGSLVEERDLYRKYDDSEEENVIPSQAKKICMENLKRFMYFLNEKNRVFPLMLGARILLRPPIKVSFDFSNEICKALLGRLLEVLEPVFISHNAIIAGSFALYMMGDDTFIPHDMDVFLTGDESDDERICREIVNAIGGEARHIQKSIGTTFIRRISEIKLFAGTFSIQVITTRSDHYRTLETFDLEFCKAVYAPKRNFDLTTARTKEAISNRKSEYRPNPWNFDINGDLNFMSRKRLKKYIERGFEITYKGAVLTSEIVDEMGETFAKSISYPVYRVYDLHVPESLGGNTMEKTYEELAEYFSK